MSITTAEDGSLVDDYAELALRHARAGDLRMAQLATWAADVHGLEGVLWDNGLGLAPDPTAELEAVGDCVAAALEEAARNLPPQASFSPRQVVELARRALVRSFDESVHALLDALLRDVAHLDLPDPGDGAQPRPSSRLGGRPAAELLVDLEVAAADCASAARQLAAAGESSAASSLALQADAAAFEAHLVSAALASGDHAGATVDLRWSLVEGERVAPGVRRQRLAAVVGAAERDLLERRFRNGAVA